MTTKQAITARDLRGIVHAIRSSWSEEERARRRRIGEARQKWLVSVVEQAAGRTRTAS